MGMSRPSIGWEWVGRGIRSPDTRESELPYPHPRNLRMKKKTLKCKKPVEGAKE